MRIRRHRPHRRRRRGCHHRQLHCHRHPRLHTTASPSSISLSNTIRRSRIARLTAAHSPQSVRPSRMQRSPVFSQKQRRPGLAAYILQPTTPGDGRTAMALSLQQWMPRRTTANGEPASRSFNPSFRRSREPISRDASPSSSLQNNGLRNPATMSEYSCARQSHHPHCRHCRHLLSIHHRPRRPLPCRRRRRRP